MFANSKQRWISVNNKGKYYTLPVERCLLLTQQHKGWEICQKYEKRLGYKKQLRTFAIVQRVDSSIELSIG